jgi:hypothetical protein
MKLAMAPLRSHLTSSMVCSFRRMCGFVPIVGADER